MKKQYLYIAGGAVVLVLVYLWYRNQQNNAATNTQDTLGTPDTQEQSDYATLAGMLQQQQAQEQGDIQSVQQALAQVPGQITQATAGFVSSTQETSDIQGVTSSQQTLAQQIAASQQQLASALSAVSGQISAAAGSAPSVAPAAAPAPSTAAVSSQHPGVSLNTALHTVEGIAGPSAMAFLNGILSGASPYHKVQGTTQKGGLSQTGTYVRAGHPTYFAFSQNGILHVRQA